MSGLPTPPMEDHKDSPARRSSKLSSSSKPAHRTSKRSSTSHDHGAVIIDGRHKRVWKACERCRMKKTKCDGESPCKRCKDDGLVCTAGSRKKTEFKQLPRGYAEVLENTQYALIATVQKLYTMVRNGESWDLGEPEMNDRGQPVIHDIASKLGCIRPSPDLPYAFPEGADDFAELQAQLQAARAEMGAHDTGRRKGSEDSTTSSPALDRTDRASSSESDHSALSKDYNQMLWQQQQQQEAAMSKANMSPVRTTPSKVQSQPIGRRDGLNVSLEAFDDGSYQQRASFESVQSMASPIYTDFRPTSPVYRNASPFSPWCGGDEFLGQSHALDVTAFYMRQQSQNAPRSAPLNGSFPLQMQMNDGMNFADGTIRPGMLDCSQSMICEDTIMFQNDFENHGMGMA